MMAASAHDIIAEQKQALEILRERIRQLEQALVATFTVPIEFGLTSSEARVFSCLVHRDFATKPQIMMAVYTDRHDEEPEPKIVDVFVCKMRKKLKPHGIVISTVWGQGYRLENRELFLGERPALASNGGDGR